MSNAIINTTLLKVSLKTSEDFSLFWPTSVTNGTVDFTGVTSIKCQLLKKDGDSGCPAEIDITGSEISMDSSGNLTIFLGAAAFAAIDDDCIYAGEVLVRVPSLTNQSVVTHELELHISPSATTWP